MQGFFRNMTLRAFTLLESSLQLYESLNRIMDFHTWTLPITESQVELWPNRVLDRGK